VVIAGIGECLGVLYRSGREGILPRAQVGSGGCVSEGEEILHFGGNGHISARLDRARRALERRPGLRLIDVPYPGFEGRTPSPTLEAFLDVLGHFCGGGGKRRPPCSGYASGIGALIALSLRARGDLTIPLIFQGPVLWGLEQRLFPRVMKRSRLARRALQGAFGVGPFQDHFAHKYVLEPLEEPERSKFFEGYVRCPAFASFFQWFTADWLRTLERAFADHPERLHGVTVWLGGRDRVVGPSEIEVTERALGVRWPLVVFASWGHYPMLDVPEEWAEALRNAVAAS
jgi:pimeloyl-ACP methyl ester carboxylesterase